MRESNTEKRLDRFRFYGNALVIIFPDQTYPDPFMIKIYNVLESKRSQVPAVTHVDGTGRLQTVARGSEPPLFGS